MKTILTIASSFLMLNAFANTAVNATNKLGMKLALEASKDVTQDQNFMISPVSLSQAVMLAGNGTSTGTRAELESLLGDRIEKFNSASYSLVKSLSSTKEEEKKIVVSINNSIWNTNGATDHAHYQFSSSFKKAAKEHYAAEIFTADFKQKSAADAINGWADKKTYGLVKKIIEVDVLQNMLWVVMNATYLEAAWAEPFYAMGSYSPVFHGLNNKTLKVPMISGEQGIGYAALEGAEIASVPFATEVGAPELEMIIYLPSEGIALRDSQSAFFRASELKNLRAQLSSKRQLARVTMPKFSFDTSVQMKEGDKLTEAMGMDFLFSDRADFSLMQTPESLASKVGLIRQNSRIELDEKGVKAAAVTIIGGVRSTSVRPQPSVNFVVNRPFHFAIVEKKTEAVLFAGTVVEPK